MCMYVSRTLELPSMRFTMSGFDEVEGYFHSSQRSSKPDGKSKKKKEYDMRRWTLEENCRI
jgi:hypothetical protein